MSKLAQATLGLVFKGDPNLTLSPQSIEDLKEIGRVLLGGLVVYGVIFLACAL